MRFFKCCIFAKIMYSSLLPWRDQYFKKLKYQSQNSQNRRSGGRLNRIYETYKNTVIPHGHHIYTKLSDMVRSTMSVYPQSYHALPHWECAMRCCAKFPH